MISPILPARDADTIALDFGVFIAEQARSHRVSQTVIIAALRPCITPSQPEGSSSPHAPAAQTDGEASSQAAPSVAPNTSAVTAAEEQARHDLVDEGKTPPEHVDSVVATSLPGAECAADRAPIPEAPKPLRDAPDTPADALLQPAEVKTSEPADGGAVSAVKGNARLENAVGVQPPPSPPGTDKTGEASASPVPTNEERLRALFVDGHQPTCKEATEALEFKSTGATAKLAKKLGLTFRKVTPEEFKARVSEGMARKAEVQRAKIQETAKALQVAPGMSLPLPPPVVKRAAPTGRFYLVERGDPTATRRYVHQSLAPDACGRGPMMTTDRRWAWFNDITKYRGAKKQWPQLAHMRKEAAHAP